ncbi:MAG: efflux RND transporter permease subunit [Armatimonadetes bacterium]|nr:efflux RND transporter permease subunit [Armatimonadota bacterium]
MNLTLSAIRRPVWVWMLVAAALVLGWRALGSLPVEQNPEVSFPNISIVTSYFGASPDEIENQISKKIEDAVTSVAGIETIDSTSTEGVSIVSIQFDLKTNQDTALADVKSKTDAIIDQLPRDAERPVVSKINFASQPILTLAAESDSMRSMDLRDFLEDRVQDRLSRIPGVAEVSIFGGAEREIRVAIDKNRLLSYGMGMVSVLDAVRGASINVPGGRITEGNRETSVRVQGEFDSVDEIRNLVIPVADREDPNAPPAIVRLQDIAEVTDGPAKRTTISRVNGREAVLLTVQKIREGNTVDITKMVHAELEKVSKEHKIKFTTTFESAESVTESIQDLNMALIIGIVLVISIIYLFLHNLRGTLIVALAIPTCLFVAFAAIQAFGFTLNTMTMLGLSLAVGILVDDAIVVLENTFRHLAKGEPPEQAALQGRAEIGLAAIAITMVDLVVFLPVAFMGGIIGQFFRPFALTVAAATITSLFVSFTLTPMLASRWYKQGEDIEVKKGFGKWFDDRFHAFANAYRELLEKALERRWLVFMAGWAFLFGIFMMIGAGAAKSMDEAIQGPMRMAMMAAAVGVVFFIGTAIRRKANFKIVLGALGFGATLVLFGVLGFQLGQRKGGPLLTDRFFGGGDTGQIQVQITMPASSSLDRTLEVVERVEGVAEKMPDAEFVTSTIGNQQSGFGGANVGSQYADVNVTLKDKAALLDDLMFWKSKGDMRTRSIDSLVSELQQKIGKVPDARVVVAAGGQFGGAPIDVRILSTNSAAVTPAALKAKDIISEVPGIVSVDLSSKPGKPELVVRPDRVRLADNDISVSQVGQAARVLYEGDTTAKYREEGREYDIRVNLADDVRDDSEALGSVPVAFRMGNPVRMADVAVIEPSVGPDKVERRDRQRQIAVTAQLLPGHVPGTVGTEITKRLKVADLGENVTFALGGENEIQAREMPYMISAFALGLVLVFLVLASLFNNILYPFIVQLSQPQALVGAFLALMVTNKPTDVVVNIGLIMLIGLVGKNAILLVDYTNTLRARGMNRHDALVEAGPTRLRPIMMTTLAMVLSMLPVAMAIGRGSEFRAPLGVVIIGGLTLSTMLTLFIIPASYTLFDDLSNSISGLVHRKRKEKPSSDGETSAHERSAVPATE